MSPFGDIQKRRLGQTDIEITPIGLGGNKFSGVKGVFGLIMPDLSPDDVNEIIKTALEGGINWIDTAEVYGFGHSEEGIAGALHAAGMRDGEVIVADKWLPVFRTAGNIRSTIDKRLKYLDGYAIDLYMIHNTMGLSSSEAEMNAMADLVEAGKIRSVGVSNFDAKQMISAHSALAKRGLPLAANQVQYSLINRSIETNGLLDAARELGVTIIAWGPLGSGILSGKYHNPERYKQAPLGRRIALRRNLERSRILVDRLVQIAARYEATPAQIAVNWLVNFQGEQVVAIPGASKPHHAEQSARAMHLKLSPEDMAKLDDLSKAFR